METFDKITDYLHIALKKLLHIITHKQSLNQSIVSSVREAKEQIDKANELIVYSDYPDLKINATIDYTNQDISFMLIDEFYNKTNDLYAETKNTHEFFCRLLLYI